MLKYFRVRQNRIRFGFRVWWNSFGWWSRITGKNRVMAYLLRRPKRNSIRLGRIQILWRAHTSRAIHIPPHRVPDFTNKTLIIHERFYGESRTAGRVDNRPTEVVLDELWNKRNR